MKRRPFELTSHGKILIRLIEKNIGCKEYVSKKLNFTRIYYLYINGKKYKNK